MMNPLKMKQQATELLKDYLDSIHARLEHMNEQMQRQLELTENLILEIKENNSAIKAMVMLHNTECKNNGCCSTENIAHASSSKSE